jgi:DNA-binding transcriptional ArsR family regulator
MLLRGGVDALLTTLSPTWNWQAPVLTLPSASRHDIALCGRGLLLVPSWFAPSAMVMYRPQKSTVLVHPMLLAEEPAFSCDVLGPLLGRTRAAVLTVLRVPATTTVLATRAGISLAAASQHATVLRNAGLVDTARTGLSVLHSLTPLGRALLAGEEPSF